MRFFELTDGLISWEALGDFQPSDVHKQVAIAFKTPRYKLLEVQYRLQAAGGTVQAAGCWRYSTGCRLLELQYRLLEVHYRLQAARATVQAAGC